MRVSATHALDLRRPARAIGDGIQLRRARARRVRGAGAEFRFRGRFRSGAGFVRDGDWAWASLAVLGGFDLGYHLLRTLFNEFGTVRCCWVVGKCAGGQLWRSTFDYPAAAADAVLSPVASQSEQCPSPPLACDRGFAGLLDGCVGGVDVLAVGFYGICGG